MAERAGDVDLILIATTKNDSKEMYDAYAIPCFNSLETLRPTIGLIVNIYFYKNK